MGKYLTNGSLNRIFTRVKGYVDKISKNHTPLLHIGRNTDAHNAYVVLCRAYNDEGGNGINGGMFNGTVYIERGGFMASIKKTAVMVQCGGQFLDNVANYQVLSDFSGGVTGLYKIIYNGQAYIALKSNLWNNSYFYASGMWTEQPFVINEDDSLITSQVLLNDAPEIASNAISATRLKTPVNILGREFDGTQDIPLDVVSGSKLLSLKDDLAELVDSPVHYNSLKQMLAGNVEFIEELEEAFSIIENSGAMGDTEYTRFMTLLKDYKIAVYASGSAGGLLMFEAFVKGINLGTLNQLTFTGGGYKLLMSQGKGEYIVAVSTVN